MENMSAAPFALPQARYGYRMNNGTLVDTMIKDALWDASISSFAKACFNFALDTKQDLWFATKDTISKKYDHNFKDIFQEIYDAEYKEKFKLRLTGAGHLDLRILIHIPVSVTGQGRPASNISIP